MAGIKISALPPVASALTTDFFPVVQGGVTSRETLAQVQTLFGYSGGVLSLSAGGTGADLTANAGGIFYSTGSAGAILSGVATAGHVLQSGAASDPSWSTPTYPSVSGTAGKVLASDGTNIVYSTATFPVVGGTAGNILISNGTNYVASTSLWPNTVGTALHLLISNGTSNIYSTPAYPNASVTAGKLIISDGTNYIASTSIWPNTVGTALHLVLSDGTSNVYSTPAYPNASVTAGKVIISDGTNYIASTSIFPNTVGNAGTILRSDGTVNAYSTATFADTYAVSTILYASASNVVSGLATTNRAALSTNSTGVPTWLALTDGQVVVGSTAGSPAAATLSAGSGISIANGSNTITISSSSNGITWNDVSGTSQTAVVNNGYIISNAAQTTVTIPATAAEGSVFAVQGKGAAGWIIQMNTGQTCHLGSSVTSSAGTLTSTNQWDSIGIVCTTANTVFAVTNVVGNITVA